MNNADVLRLMDDCQDDLNRVKSTVDVLGHTSNVIPYLNKYAIIRACGAVEVAYKSVVADYCDTRAGTQIQTFLKKHVRENSKNPNYANICSLLKEFDDNWNTEFKDRIKNHPDKSKIETSIQSLVDARNEFAHGGNPSSTVSDVLDYFSYFRIVIEIIDDIVK